MYSKGPKQNYATDKTDVYHIDDIWSSDILGLKDYGSENNKGYRYVLVIIDNFVKIGWTVPLKSKNTQTIKESFENILMSSKRKPGFIESDRGKKFYNHIYENFLNNNNTKLYSGNSSFGSVFAERFYRTIRDLLKKPVCEKGGVNCIDRLPFITKQYNIRIPTPTTLASKQASLRKNEGFVYQNLLDKRSKLKPKFQVNDLVRTTDLKKTFSKGEKQTGLIYYVKLQK